MTAIGLFIGAFIVAMVVFLAIFIGLAAEPQQSHSEDTDIDYE